MTDGAAEPAGGPWADAALAAALFAVDPFGTGGVVLRAPWGPARDRWLALLRGLLPPAAPWRPVPLHAADDRLLGGLDLAATLRTDRPVAERGLLAEAAGGVLVLGSAERLTPAAAGRLLPALDATEVAAVALDEGIDPEERPPAALLDRLAFHLEPGAEAAPTGLAEAATVAAARKRLPEVEVPDEAVDALCAAAAALGVASLRAPLLASRAARAAAALAGRPAVAETDASLAARLVLAPRATVLPVEAAAEPPPADAAEPEEARKVGGEPLRDLVLAAARAALPERLLERLKAAGGARANAAGRRGPLQSSAAARGRPAGTRRGDPRAGQRLDLVATLRAAAPWQALRRSAGGGRAPRVLVRREDFRVARRKERARATTLFLVDASGSTALQRLAEAKGAVELLLADCYVRRDRVALLAFRGEGAELLLPPTRSLARAKRGLADLPGGGGTPVAAGLDAAFALAGPLRRRGEVVQLVLLTDGRANVARDGTSGRERAFADALAAARRVRAAGLDALLVDTAPQPQARARELAGELGALYLPLPRADASTLRGAVRAAAPRR